MICLECTTAKKGVTPNWVRKLKYFWLFVTEGGHQNTVSNHSYKDYLVINYISCALSHIDFGKSVISEQELGKYLAFIPTVA